MRNKRNLDRLHQNLRENAAVLVRELSLAHPGGCANRCVTCQVLQHTRLTLKQLEDMQDGG